MIRAIVTDFSGVLLNAVDKNYTGGLNAMYRKMRDREDFDYHQLFQLNESLLNFYSYINTSVPVYIFTTGYVQEDPAVRDRIATSVSGVYSAEREGLSKDDPEAYKEIASRIGCDVNELIFIDDRDYFVSAAEKAGYTGIVFTSTDDVMKKVIRLIK